MASSPVVITGTVTDSSGRPACSGWVDFILQPSNQSLPYSVLPNIVVATPTRALIVAGGQLVDSCSRNDAFSVWPNDVILPANSLYQIVVAPCGRVTRVLNGVLISQATNPQSLANLTFISPQNQVVGPVIDANPLVTMSMTPGVDSVFNVGSAQNYFSSGYFRTLYVDNIVTSGGITFEQPIDIPSSNVLGQPQPGQLVLLYAAPFPITFPVNLTTSVAAAKIGSAAAAVYNVQSSGTNVATVTFNGLNPTFASAGFILPQGGFLSMTAPNPMDATLSDVAITLVGTALI